MTDSDTLESRLADKLKNGEISQDEYDELYNKFLKLGILSSKSDTKVKRKSVSRSGESTIDGRSIDGPVSITGRSLIEGPVNCERLSISGSARVDGNLTVLGKTSISGQIIVEGNAKFKDQVAISGSLYVEQNLSNDNKFSLQGKSTVSGDFTSMGPLVLSGNFRSRNIICNSIVKVYGRLRVEEDVQAELFECTGGSGTIGGDLEAESIAIFTKFRESLNVKKIDVNKEDDFLGINEMVSNVVNVVFPSIMKSVSGLLDSLPSAFKVSGSIIGGKIDISNTKISGDIIGNYVTIGPGVEVGGVIKYRDFIEVPDNKEYQIIQLKD